MNRQFTLTLIIAAGLTANVLAGGEQYSAKDKAVAPMAPPPCDWTGFYVGGSMGWRGGDSRWFDGQEFPVDSLLDGDRARLSKNFESGFIIGLQGGYNRQLTNWFVLGVEATASWSTNFGPDGEQIYANAEPPGSTGGDVYHFRTENDFTGTLALRAGVSFLNNKMLVYAKGGGAATHWNYAFKESETQENGFFQEFRYEADETRFSPLVGAGIEYAISCHWSARVEYNHIFLGRETNTGALTFPQLNNAQQQTVSVQQLGSRNVSPTQEVNYDSVQVGLNYKF